MHHQGRVAVAVRFAGLFAGAALLAGCDSASEPPAAEQDKPAESASGGGQVACTAENLEATMAPGDVGSGKKTWNTTLQVRNVGADECGLQGTGELTFYGETGAPLKATQQAKGEGPASGVVTVAPGEHAMMTVHYGSTAGGAAPANCPTPAMAKVVLSGNEASVDVAPPEEMAAMPPLCGKEIQVSPWASA
jgi:hypothetical protein